MSRRWLFVLLAGFVCCALRAAGWRQIEMTRVGRLAGEPPTVACRGHLVVWGMGKQLQVFDTTAPGPPQLMSELDIDRVAMQMVFVRDRFVAVCSVDKVFLVDLTEPTLPRLCSSFPGLNGTEDMAFHGDLLAIANCTPWPRFELFDISDVDQPRAVGGLDLCARHLAFAGNLALLGYTADGAKVDVVDVTLPTSPFLRTTMEISANASIRDMASSGTTVLIATSRGLFVFDFSQADNPVMKGIWNAENWFSGVAVAGNRAAVLRPGSISILDLSDPSTVTLLGTLWIPVGSSSSAGGIGYCGDVAYVTTDNAGVLKIDVSDPRAPRLDGGYYIPGDARGVAVWGDTVWVANGGAGVIGIDISDPANPRGEKLLPFEGDFPTTTAAADYGIVDAVTIRDGLAYVAAIRSFSVLDVRDLSTPSQIGLRRYASPVEIPNSRVSLSGRYAVLSDTSAATLLCPLRVMDIEDPTSPTLIGMYWGPGAGIPDALIADRLVYFLDSNTMGGGVYLRIAELETGGALTARGSVPLGIGAIWRLALEWPCIYTTIGDDLTVCDVSDPDAPFVCGSVPLPEGGVVWDMFIRSSILFVAYGDKGLLTFDLTNPYHPRLCGSYKMEGSYSHAPYVLAIYADDKYVYLATGSHGFELLRYQYRASSRDWQTYE